MVNIGIDVMNTVLSEIASYRKVGDLKSEAIRTLGMATGEALQTSSGTYIDYENTALISVEEDLDQFVRGGARYLRENNPLLLILNHLTMMSLNMEELVNCSRKTLDHLQALGGKYYRLSVLACNLVWLF